MAYWKVDNVWAYLCSASHEEESEVFNHFRIRPKNYFFDYRYRAGIWDGYEYFFDRSRKRILAGLLPLAREMGFDYNEEHVAVSPLTKLNDFTLEGITFNRKQEEAQKALRSGVSRGIFDMATGVGKTVCFVAFVKALNLKTLIIVPGKELLGQTVNEFKRLMNIECGRFGGGHKEIDKQVTVTTDDSLKRLPKWTFDSLAQQTEVLIMDEVHNCTDKLNKFLTSCSNAYYRYGFSGTPFDLGKARSVQIIGHFGPVIVHADDKDLVEMGRGVPSKFIFCDVHLRDDPMNALDYCGMYTSCITNNVSFHEKVASIVETYDDGTKSILVLVRRIEHGNYLKQFLAARGIKCEFTNGKQASFSREKAKEDFKSQKLRVLIASDIYREGVDIPCIEVLILAGAGESSKDWKQRVGRGLRSHSGKDEVLVYDFMFRGNSVFEKHSKQRLKLALEMESGTVYREEPLLGTLTPLSLISPV